MGFSKQAISHFRKDSAIITSACLRGKEWEATIDNAEISARPAVLIYAWDWQADWTWMCSMEKEGFTRVSTDSCNSPALHSAIRSNASTLIARAADGGSPEPIDGLEWRHALALTLAAYAGSTQSWELNGRLAQGGHFIVLNYRQGDGSSMLRPIAIPARGITSRDVFPSTRLRQLVWQFCDIDRMHHPEWFPVGTSGGR